LLPRDSSTLKKARGAGLIAIVVCDFAFEPAFITQISPSFARALITFVGTVPFEVDAVERDAAIARCLQRTERHVTSSLSLNLDEGRAYRSRCCLPANNG
jgi:hypothetical protein